MAERTSGKEQAGKRAEAAFKSAERRDTTSKQIVETERASTAAKTKKLRALRLAKEAAELSDKDEPASHNASRKKRL